jgi:hypothetical protein
MLLQDVIHSLQVNQQLQAVQANDKHRLCILICKDCVRQELVCRAELPTRSVK